MSKRRIYRYRRAAPIAIGEFMSRILEKMGGRPGQDRLARLWVDWDQVLGSVLAQLAQPIGTQGKTLLIGAQNSIHMQELQFQGETILELVNAYLGSSYFEKVRFNVYRTGKICRCAASPAVQGRFAPTRRQMRQRGARQMPVSGKYLKDMDKLSPVARCYAAFCNK